MIGSKLPSPASSVPLILLAAFAVGVSAVPPAHEDVFRLEGASPFENAECLTPLTPHDVNLVSSSDSLDHEETTPLTDEDTGQARTWLEALATTFVLPAKHAPGDGPRAAPPLRVEDPQAAATGNEVADPIPLD